MNSYRVLALVSGGKDSCYSMIQCVSAGHTIVGIANLRPNDDKVHELDSYMYQTVGHTAISLYAEAMNLPLFCGQIRRSSVATSSNDYEPTSDDEVEDLFELLTDVKKKLEFDAICSGAILSDYQRIRVENVCSRLGLISLAYLWRRDQSELLDEMLNCGKIKAIVVKVATLGLNSCHLGRSLQTIRPRLHEMNQKYGINVCGEGGEYETFTLDCPLFYKSLVVKEKEVIVHSDDAFAPVLYLKLKSIKLRDKNVGPFSSQLEMILHNGAEPKTPNFFAKLIPCLNNIEEELQERVNVEPPSKKFETSPTFHQVESKSLFSISNIMASSSDPTVATKEILETLKEILLTNGSSMRDLCSVTLLVADMSQYGLINAEYIRHFANNPPVRVCIQVNSGHCASPLILSAIGRSTQSSAARNVMHVQSISHWAPANIGPYSQVVEVNGTIFVAGQIGLIPGSMVLADGVENQAKLGLRHVCRVLEAFKCSIMDVVQVVCYVAGKYHHLAFSVWVEERFRTLEPPFWISVEVPRLPRDALIEWQVVAKPGHRKSASETSYPIELGFGTNIEYEDGGRFTSVDIHKRGDRNSDWLSVFEDWLDTKSEDSVSTQIFVLTKHIGDILESKVLQEKLKAVTIVPVLSFENFETVVSCTFMSV